MFGFLKKTKKKAEEGIEKAEVTLEHINDVAVEMKQAMIGIKFWITLSSIGVLLGITADIVSIIVSGRTAKIVKK